MFWYILHEHLYWIKKQAASENGDAYLYPPLPTPRLIHGICSRSADERPEGWTCHSRNQDERGSDIIFRQLDVLSLWRGFAPSTPGAISPCPLVEGAPRPRSYSNDCTNGDPVYIWKTWTSPRRQLLTVLFPQTTRFSPDERTSETPVARAAVVHIERGEPSLCRRLHGTSSGYVATASPGWSRGCWYDQDAACPRWDVGCGRVVFWVSFSIHLTLLLFVTRFVLFPSHSPTVLIRSLCGNVLRLAG